MEMVITLLAVSVLVVLLHIDSNLAAIGNMLEKKGRL